MAKAGQVARADGLNVANLKVKGLQNIAKGDYISTDVNGFAKQAATTDSRDRGFFIALEASDNSGGADGDKSVRVACPGSWVWGQLGGALKVGSLVKITSATKVIAHSKPANAAATYAAAETDAARDYFGLTVGRFYGKDAADVESAPADGADTNIGLLHLGGGA
jgi:hypothetical protein